MRSPLKARPLRNPGQSLDEKLIDHFFDASQYMVTAIFLVILAAIEWWKYHTNVPPSPVAHSLVAFVGVIFCSIKIRQIVNSGRRYKLGRDGEKCVGQYLDKLREDGVQVFHDIIADNFNLDHVIISNAGIFIVETKTLSKPDSGASIIEYDGKTITKNGFSLERNPVVQVESAAKYLSNEIYASTGKQFNTRGIVTFPGWFVKSRSNNSNNETWVLNPKAIPAFISNSPKLLSNEDVKLASYHLSRMIRTCVTK